MALPSTRSRGQMKTRSQGGSPGLRLPSPTRKRSVAKKESTTTKPKRSNCNIVIVNRTPRTTRSIGKSAHPTTRSSRSKSKPSSSSSSSNQVPSAATTRVKRMLTSGNQQSRKQKGKLITNSSSRGTNAKRQVAPLERLTEGTNNLLKSNRFQCPTCGFPLRGDSFGLIPLEDLMLLRIRHNNYLCCDGCNQHFNDRMKAHVQKREFELICPKNPRDYPCQAFRVGGVPTGYMIYFLSLKRELSEHPQWFHRITTTGSAGKFLPMTVESYGWKSSRVVKDLTLQTRAIDNFMSMIAAQLPLGKDGYRRDPQFVKTVTPTVQVAHRDLRGYENMDKAELDLVPWALHCPLCKEGMWLNIWSPDKSGEPVRVHIPFGTFLLTRVDVLHGGIFGSSGNVRLHIAFLPLLKAIEEKCKNLRISKALSAKHKRLGWTEAGPIERRLDLILEDEEEESGEESSSSPNDVKSFPIAYEEPSYVQRLAEDNAAVWDPSMIDNI